MGIVSPLDGYNKCMSKLDTECLGKIREALDRFQRDPIYRGAGKRVPLRQFADLCGLSRQSLYDIVGNQRKGIEPRTRDRILAALKLVNAGLRFRRVTLQKAIVTRTCIVHQPAIVEWQAVMPNGQRPPPIPGRPRGLIGSGRRNKHDQPGMPRT
jgi:hypothetical protein